MLRSRHGGYPAVKADQRHTPVEAFSSATEDALAGEGRGVQEDALMSGGEMGVEDGTAGAPPLRGYPRADKGARRNQ